MKVAGRGWERHAGTLCPYFVARPRGVTDSLQEARPRLPLEAAPTAHECRPQAHPHQETRHYRAPASHLHVLITTSAPGVVDETATRFIGSNVENSDARDSIVAAICGDWHLLRRIANQTVGLVAGDGGGGGGRSDTEASKTRPPPSNPRTETRHPFSFPPPFDYYYFSSTPPTLPGTQQHCLMSLVGTCNFADSQIRNAGSSLPRPLQRLIVAHFRADRPRGLASFRGLIYFAGQWTRVPCLAN
jgi:hypothetical protein